MEKSVLVPVLRPAWLFCVVLLSGCFALVAGGALAAVDQWSALGPTGGEVGDLVEDRSTAPPTLYATASAGVFRSVDGGAQWQLLSEEISGVLVVDPADSSTLYGAVSNLVRKSVDGGQSWVDASNGLEGRSISSLVVDPLVAGTLYVGTDEGVFRSTNAAESWSGSGVGTSGLGIAALAVDPSGAGTFYAGTETGSIYRSADGGESWALSFTGSEQTFLALAVSPADSRTVFAAGSDTLLVSLDAGETWNDTGRGRVSAIGLPASDGGVAYAAETVSGNGDGRIYRSEDGGATWGLFDAGLPPATTIHRFQFQASEVLAATSRGIYRTANDIASWLDSSDGLVSTFVRSVALDSEQTDTVYLSTFSSGLFRSTDAGDRWTRLDTGTSDFTLAAVVADPSIPGRVWAVDFPATVLRSTDRGDSWTPWSEGLGDVVVSTLVVSPTGTLFVGTQSHGVYQRRTLETNWQQTISGMGEVEIERLAVSPSDPQIVYASGRDGLFRSQDAGTTWSSLGDDLLGPLLTLAVDPADSEVLLASGRLQAGAGILRSLDGGASWNLMGGPSVAAMVFDPREPNIVYAGGWRSTDRGVSWSPWVNGSDLGTIRALAAVRGSALYAGTDRRGAFRIEPPPVLTLQGGRFLVEARWRDFEGQEGVGTVAELRDSGGAVPLRSEDSAVLEFFDRGNWEMLIKVLDGRSVNQNFWVFAGGATTVAYTATVTDTSCGTVRVYENPLGFPAPAVTDTEAFPPCAQPVPPSCVDDGETLCLGDDARFQLEVTWRDFTDQSGRGRQVELPEPGLARSRDSGLFYFFDGDNWEVLIKVLDGCAFNDAFWVFSAATTDVAYDLEVTDTLTGRTRVYSNALGTSAAAVVDIETFGSCELDDR